ncbi:MAG: gliding motility-associated C-terminal domain-containing protein [Tannerellaceae bacterium]
MLRKEFRRLGEIACMLLLALTVCAQYTVKGGSGTPLLATTDKDVQVYLVNGTNDVSISYTAKGNGSLQWYRYKTKALEAEKLSGTQSGNVTTLQNIQEGYGYFVTEQGQVPRYVWIIDYSQYAFNIQSLSVSPDSNCDELRLNGSAEMKPLRYYPSNGGFNKTLKRQFEVTYNTMTWSDDTKLFSQEVKTKQIEGDPFLASLDAPLCDTDIRLSGDLFARHFGMEKSMSTGSYEAIALEVHADTTIVIDQISNLMSGSEGLSAPADIRFTAHANTPVAALYTWTIYPKEQPENFLVRFTGEEVDYTFNQFGDYVAALTVSDRTGKCSNSEHSFDIKITESGLDVPNAFSPGTSPGINDEFRVAYKSLIRFQGWIFNRWGVEMFRWNDPARGWDGKKGGKYVTPGVYFYVIEAEGSDGIKYKRKGDINILRSKNIQDEVVE